MIKLFEEQNISTYQLQKELGLGKYTLYRYANGERSVKNMPAKTLYKLSKCLNINIDMLYSKMCEYEQMRGFK